MRILVVGVGKVGKTLAENLTQEQHDVVLIDNDEEVLRHCEDLYDVLCVQGNGANAQTLIDAGVDHADILIAVTAGDEITVKAIVTDNDKSPDVGTNNSKHTVTEKEIKDGFTISFNVKVRENKGRYTGNTATWKISYKFTPSK